MIKSIHVDLTVDGRYEIEVTDQDGTASGTSVRAPLSTSIYNALAEATAVAARMIEADRQNETPGQVVRGGKQPKEPPPEFCQKNPHCLLIPNHKGECHLARKRQYR